MAFIGKWTEEKIRLKQNIILLAGLIVLLLVINVFAPKNNREVAFADTAGFSGYAWSDNIGWVSLSGSNYGFVMDSSGKLSGYAWSDNIGWITANESELSGCPTNPCRAKMNGDALTGWLRALSNGGGWDGWISLSGSGYGVTRSGSSLSGYAWGGDVVGWLDFSLALAPPEPDFVPSEDGLTGHLQFVPETISLGDTSQVHWNVNNVTSCSVTGTNGDSWTGLSSGSAGKTSSPILDQTTYTLRCSAYQGVTPPTITETSAPSCTPEYSCSGTQTIQYTDSSCNTTTVTTCASPTFCSAGSSTCLYPQPSFTPTVGTDFTGHLQPLPALVTSGDTIQVRWNVDNVTSCSVTGTNGDSWTGLSSGSGGKTSSPIVGQTTYTLTCSAYPGVTPPTLTESETANIIPIFQEM